MDGPLYRGGVWGLPMGVPAWARAAMAAACLLPGLVKFNKLFWIGLVEEAAGGETKGFCTWGKLRVSGGAKGGGGGGGGGGG